jgi:hypothetical protein
MDAGRRCVRFGLQLASCGTRFNIRCQLYRGHGGCWSIVTVVTGMIVTDCDSCVLAPTDITSFSFTEVFTLPSGNPGFTDSFSGNTSNVTGTSTYPLSAGNGIIDFTGAGGQERFVVGADTLIFGSPGVNGVTFTDPGLGDEVLASTPLQIATEIAATPLPAALPLFANGLGVMGLFGWRRKRKAQAAA